MLFRNSRILGSVTTIVLPLVLAVVAATRAVGYLKVGKRMGASEEKTRLLDKQTDSLLDRIDKEKIELPEDITGFVNVVYEFARHNGVRVRKIVVDPDGRIVMSLTGSFNDLGGFFSRIEHKLPRFETQGFEFRREKGRLVLELNGLYRYHD